MFFVYIVVGCAMINASSSSAFTLIEALAAGSAAIGIIYSISHVSGGFINPAITIGALVAKKLVPEQAVSYCIAQILGGMCGCFLLCLTVKHSSDSTPFGTNTVQSGYETINAFVGEMIMTFVLTFVVLQTTSDRDAFTRATYN
eukprot:UN28172